MTSSRLKTDLRSSSRATTARRDSAHSSCAVRDLRHYESSVPVHKLRHYAPLHWLHCVRHHVVPLRFPRDDLLLWYNPHRRRVLPLRLCQLHGCILFPFIYRHRAKLHQLPPSHQLFLLVRTFTRKVSIFLKFRIKWFRCPSMAKGIVKKATLVSYCNHLSRNDGPPSILDTSSKFTVHLRRKLRWLAASNASDRWWRGRTFQNSVWPHTEFVEI